MDNSALIVMDVQKIFTAYVPNSKQMLSNIVYLIERARKTALPIIFVRHDDAEMSPKGTPRWDLHESLSVLPGDIFVEKAVPSAFVNTTLKSELDQRSVSRLIFCGLATDGCLEATVLDALKMGYHVTVADDAHSCCHKGYVTIVPEKNAEFAAAGATVKPTKEVTF